MMILAMTKKGAVVRCWNEEHNYIEPVLNCSVQVVYKILNLYMRAYFSKSSSYSIDSVKPAMW